MKNIDQQIRIIINKIKKRLFLVQWIRYLLKFLVIGMLMGMVIEILSRFVPIYKPYKITIIILVISTLLSLIWALIKTPKDITTALKTDALGLKERVVTSLELEGDSSVIAQLQKKDALDYLQKLDYKKELSFVPNKKSIISFLILGCLLTGLFYLPNPMKEIAQKKHEIKIVKKDAVKDVEKVQKKIEKNEKISDWMKLDANNNLKKLKKELSEAKNNEEINKAIQKSSKKLELMKKKYLDDDLEKVADTFMKNEITKELGKLIKDGNKEELLKKMDEVAESLKNASPEEIEKLSKGLSKLAQELKNNPNLAKAFGELASNLAKGNISTSSEAMNEMSSTLSQLMENQEFAKAMEDIQQSLDKTAEKCATNSNSGNKQGTGG
ncbi:hypothetical protein SH2C18_47770 [Clostridium sediminicola]|uniref:hypothetical protein n=1 Tax=Clostridium sediminicola TaxID=3114879 RepID=UPI0031F1FBCA